MQVLRINDRDNVVVALQNMVKGETVTVDSVNVSLAEDVPRSLSDKIGQTWN